MARHRESQPNDGRAAERPIRTVASMRVTDTPIVEARWALPGQLAHADPELAESKRSKRTPRDWVVDVTVFVLSIGFWVSGFFQLAVLTYTGDNAAAPIHRDLSLDTSVLATVIDPIVGGLLILALWWRRRFPVTLSVLAVLATCFSSTSSSVAFIMIFTLAVHRPWPISIPIGLAHVPTTLIYEKFQPNPYIGTTELLVVSTLVIIAVLAWGIAVRARRQLVLSLRSAADQERQQHQMLLHDTRRAERANIAREMHDVLAHRISLLSVHAGALEYRTQQAELGTAAPLTASEVNEAVGVIRVNAHQALEELREVLTVLRSDSDDSSDEPTETDTAAPQIGIAGLAALVDEAVGAGQQVRLDITAPGVDDLRPQLQRTIFRVVQEGLTNARKHAPDAPVNVIVFGHPGESIIVELTNVVPIAPLTLPIPGAGAGLTGLRERVVIEGGTLDAGVSAGAFRLKVRLPWRP
jgi:signal transduction histidine kinase